MTDVTDRDQNRTEPNLRWPRRRGSDAIPRTRVRARVTEVGEGSTPTESERRSGPPAFLLKLGEGADGIWSKKTPTIADLLRYAAEGQQMAENSPLRGPAKAYTYAVAIPATAVSYWLAWIFQRPLRLLALIVVVALAALFLP